MSDENDIRMLFTSVKKLIIDSEKLPLVNDSSSDCDMLVVFKIPLNKSMINAAAWIKWCQKRITDLNLSVLPPAVRLSTLSRELVPEKIFAIYSDSPFYRPIALILKASFLYPYVQIATAQKSDLFQALKQSADNQVAHIPSAAFSSGLKLTATSLGFTTESLMSAFQFFIPPSAALAIQK
ncbi:hypothetical protein Ciccas_001378 [Cichlidogyrus casuarinus]|uniref:Uncharacterized protein n=1 Tax=Cichlidogyrus casuarinus TaxID=1844966 RepID=A0ABD2QK98_9PLAT